MIDEWADHPLTQFSVVLSLEEGNHQIYLEYYENLRQAKVKLDWASTSEEPEQINPYSAQYFDNKNLEGQPKLIRQDAVIDYAWNHDSPAAPIPGVGFSVRWTRDEVFEASGEYQFLIKADDGIRFYIDDEVIVDDWSGHSMRTYTPTVDLTAGAHTLRIEFYENTGNAIAVFKQGL